MDHCELERRRKEGKFMTLSPLTFPGVPKGQLQSPGGEPGDEQRRVHVQVRGLHADGEG